MNFGCITGHGANSNTGVNNSELLRIDFIDGE